MDVKIKCQEGDFKFRVCVVLINDDKVLTVNICNNGFYCLPGGHVHLGEDTTDAIRREIKEEIDVEVKEISLMAIIENFFKNSEGKVFHELGYYYLIKPENLGDKINDFNLVENDEGELKKLEFKWFKLDDIKEVNFRPEILKESLKNRDFSFKHIIFKD